MSFNKFISDNFHVDNNTSNNISNPTNTTTNSSPIVAVLTVAVILLLFLGFIYAVNEMTYNQTGKYPESNNWYRNNNLNSRYNNGYGLRLGGFRIL